MVKLELPGERLVRQLAKTLLDNGIGSLFRPWQIRREGRAHTDVRAEEIRAIAQAEADAKAIQAGQFRLGPGGALMPVETARLSASAEPQEGALAELAPEAEPQRLLLPDPIAHGDEPRRLLPSAIVGGMLSERLRREVNVGRAIHFAEDELLALPAGSAPQVPEGSDQAPAETPRQADADWLLRWRDAASEVSNVELQHLWGRVLAGEVKAPGTFSLRALEFLRNVSQEEARTIELVSRYVLQAGSSHFLIRNESSEVAAAPELPFHELLALQDLGIISGVGGTGLSLTVGSALTDRYMADLMGRGHALRVEGNDPSKKLQLNSLSVTKLGETLIGLSAVETPVSHLRAVGESIKQKGYTVTLFRALPLGGTLFRLEGAEEL